MGDLLKASLTPTYFWHLELTTLQLISMVSNMSRISATAALLSSLATAIFFAIYAASPSPIRTLCGLAVFSAVLNAASTISICLQALVPSRTHRQVLIASVPFLAAAIVSACTLGWFWLRPQDLPVRILRQPSQPTVLAGFAVYILSAITQSVFWATTQLPPTRDMESSPQCQCASARPFAPVGVVPSLPPRISFASKSSLSLTLRVSTRIFRLPFVKVVHFWPFHRCVLGRSDRR